MEYICGKRRETPYVLFIFTPTIPSMNTVSGDGRRLRPTKPARAKIVTFRLVMPKQWIEHWTFCLQDRCSTTELTRPTHVGGRENLISYHIEFFKCPTRGIRHRAPSSGLSAKSVSDVWTDSIRLRRRTRLSRSDDVAVVTDLWRRLFRGRGCDARAMCAKQALLLVPLYLCDGNAVRAGVGGVQGTRSFASGQRSSSSRPRHLLSC